MIDNYGLWKKHDRLREEEAERYAKLNRMLDMAIEGVEKALNVLEEDFDKGCEMLRDLIDRLEDER